MTTRILLLVIVMICSLPTAGIATEREIPVKNVIVMIPDGFSTGHATNYRLYKQNGAPVWDDLLVGAMRTNSADSAVTDSAAAATAMATGVKTVNGRIGISPKGKKLQTILEVAKEEGKATGLVATLTVTHATPAAFAAKVDSRSQKEIIAPQLIDNVDVLLGGGKTHFLPIANGGIQQNRNVINEAKKAGFTFVDKKEELLTTDATKLLGLFSDEELAPEFERETQEQPSLSEMTEVALSALQQNEEGFFLMVEGSQIDWAGHDNDAAWAMKEIEAFEEAVMKALDFAKTDGNTLVIIVSDHDNGGMSVGADGRYASNIKMLRDVKATGEFMAEQLSKNHENAKVVLETYANVKLTNTEYSQIVNASDPTDEINAILSERAIVGWTSTVHTGEDVPLYAFGPKANLFSGNIDNTDLPKIIARAMGMSFER
ncbi:alkaline phosphatase [Bacillus alkalicellulosilyticus]|uniref:alkaline phosphatase n=1 Tax=Alkalihalobacterium alkalicellulosilyticum TaxID=1912214 RepID=UPI000995EE91|nr:alkaline phosphatase [Bacillus alkalicellulosilyticus]